MAAMAEVEDLVGLNEVLRFNCCWWEIENMPGSLEHGVGAMEDVWICHEGGAGTNKAVHVQMGTLSSRQDCICVFYCE